MRDRRAPGAAPGIVTVLLALVLTVAGICGCSQSSEVASGQATSSGATSATAHPDASTSAPAEDAAGTSDERLSAPTTWDESESPNYVRLVGDAVIEGDLEPGQVTYSDLDSLGRTGQVRACITHQMMEEGSARERASDMPEPSGWPAHNPEVTIELPTGRLYEGRFWNRSHLLAKSLGGSDERVNLVTGTRMQNAGADNGQGGMDMVETALRDWLDSYPDVTVQFVATPLYQGDELICRSVVVDVRSSDGHINEELEVYNACKGFSIDYLDGTIEATEQADSSTGTDSATGADSASEAQGQVATGDATQTNAAQSNVQSYVLNTSTRKFHYPDCRSVRDMKSENRQDVEAMREDLIAQGYSPCGRCNP